MPTSGLQKLNPVEEIVRCKGFKAKEKSNAIFRLLQESKIEIAELIKTAKSSKDSEKASCIEALEYYTKANPQNANVAILEFVSDSLKEKAPRIKWESASVIENIAPLFPLKLEHTILNLIANTENLGKVVRWSTAKALARILEIDSNDKTFLKAKIKAI